MTLSTQVPIYSVLAQRASKLLALGPTLEVLKNPDVQKAYLGNFDDLEVAA